MFPRKILQLRTNKIFIIRGSGIMEPNFASSISSCSPDKFVSYKVVLETFWDPELFPKQYPEWRPPAQWSKVIGFSHNDDYNLFHIGSIASDSVKEFAETGSTESLDKVSDSLILDVFSAPPIPKGAGRTQGSIFLDGNHTQVSLMSKLVPSPDWFIGLDALDLCKDGRFIDSIVIESDPIDAGSDNGFTFTSPNWPTEPRAEIFKITNVYPSHPAGSFNYPELSSLPTIATFSLIKEREYEMSEDFTLKGGKIFANDEKYTVSNDSDKKMEVKLKEIMSSNSIIDEKYKHLVKTKRKNNTTTLAPQTTTASESKEEKETNESEWNRILKEEILQKSPKKLRHSRNRSSGKRDRVKSFRNRHGGEGYLASMGPKAFLKKAIQKKSELYQRILNSYKSSKGSKLKKRKLRKLRRKQAHRGPRNCRVGKWGDWGTCSKTCGIGESVRSRSIVHKPKRGGKPCPGLKSVKWCGSARNCAGKYFDW
ncbi:Spondin-2 [Lepeophtheirus salmonis]|uniref:Spondin-2 n=1 Tax=Lepeophtheirus salmonis TaxID=72036 RepID=A0A7R8CJW3_LEPSM|nr:Spondin-2 [Lepeophtheirus salmonis]CAF2844387.1 Spondin-2 [Lepeophtheirus salmonis]